VGFVFLNVEFVRLTNRVRAIGGGKLLRERTIRVRWIECLFNFNYSGNEIMRKIQMLGVGGSID